jgi:hypothetical protein
MKLRNDMLEPRRKKSKTDKLDPILVIPKTLKLEPKREKL